MAKIIPATLEWSENNQKWLLKFGDNFAIKKYRGKFAYDFWDCGTVLFVFNPDKNKVNKYVIKIEEIDGRS